MSTNELIEQTANGIEEDLLEIEGVDVIPADMSYRIKNRLHDLAREMAAGAKREITSGLEGLVNQALG